MILHGVQVWNHWNDMSSSYMAHLIAPTNWAQDNKNESSWDADPISSLGPNLWLCWVRLLGQNIQPRAHEQLGPGPHGNQGWVQSQLHISGCQTFSYFFEIMAYLLCSILIWKVSMGENHSLCNFDALSPHQLLILLLMWRYCWPLHNGRGPIYAYLNFSTTQ